MSMSVTDLETIQKYQGDRVMIFKHMGDELVKAHVLTAVCVVDSHKCELHLTNHDSASHKPDWLLTQALFDHFRPAGNNKEQAKWALTIKSK